MLNDFVKRLNFPDVRALPHQQQTEGEIPMQLDCYTHTDNRPRPEHQVFFELIEVSTPCGLRRGICAILHTPKKRAVLTEKQYEETFKDAFLRGLGRLQEQHPAVYARTNKKTFSVFGLNSRQNHHLSTRGNVP